MTEITITKTTTREISLIKLPKNVLLKMVGPHIYPVIEAKMEKFYNVEYILDELQKCIANYSMWKAPFNGYVCAAQDKNPNSIVSVKLIDEKENLWGFYVHETETIKVDSFVQGRDVIFDMFQK